MQIAPTDRTIRLALFFLIWALGLQSLQAEGADQSAAESSSPAAPAAASPAESAVLPPEAPRQAPPGFAANQAALRLYSGPALAAPGGSFVRHEKLYDRTLRLGGQLGQVESAIPSLPAIVFNSNYESGGLFAAELELGLNSHIGAGLTISVSNIFVRRQDVVRGLSITRQILEPVPTYTSLLSVASLQFLFSLHPFPEQKFDPYLILRGGPAFASGKAHAGYSPDLTRANDTLQNGRGFSYGGGLGLNFYLHRNIALNLETSYQFSALKADQFNSRSVYNSYLTIGVTLRTEP
ncbi:MAG: hypothetical protein K1X75_16005 [Leptospirales bacterium]|nr:hypothetical protein [Leptospirales bacterium]